MEGFGHWYSGFPGCYTVVRSVPRWIDKAMACLFVAYMLGLESVSEAGFLPEAAWNFYFESRGFAAASFGEGWTI